MNKLGKIAQILQPTLLGVVLLLAGLGFYYYRYLPEREEAQAERLFRHLGEMSDQLVQSFVTLSNSLNFAAEDGFSQAKAATTKSNAPSLVKDAFSAGVDSFVPKLKIDFFLLTEWTNRPVEALSDPTNQFLRMTVERRRSKPRLICSGQWAFTNLSCLLLAEVSTDFNDFGKPIIQRHEFDGLLLVAGNRSVAWQQDEVVPRLDRLPALIQHSASRRGQAGTNSFDLAETVTPTLGAANMAARRFVFFLQPVALNVMPPPEAGAQTNAWFLCGVINEAALEKRAQPLPYLIVLGLSTAFVVLLLLLPFLNIAVSGTRSRLQGYHVVYLIAAAAGGVGGVVVVCAHVAQDQYQKAKLDARLAPLADTIKKSFQAEITNAVDWLSGFSTTNLTNASLPATNRVASVTNYLPENLLQQMPAGLRQITWIRSNGLQAVKWSTAPQVTPLIQLADRQYFRKIMDNEDFPIGLKTGDLSAARRFFVEPIYSRLRAENVAVCSIRAPTNQVAGETNLTVLCAEFLPASVMRPLLPPGFLFAVLDRTGQVLFHSDDSRNLRENFVTECGNDTRLRAALAGRIADEFELEYYQRPHHVRIEPLEGFPWALVVLRDQGPLNSVRASQATTILAVLLPAGALWLILGLLVGLWRVQVQRRQGLPRWLWPNEASAEAYRAWSRVNALVLCGYVVLELSQFPLARQPVVFWLAIVLGPACVAGSCVWLAARHTLCKAADQGSFAAVDLVHGLPAARRTLCKAADQRAFVIWLATSFAVFVIPGVLATHRLAAEIETERFVRWTQAKLGQEIFERWRKQPTGLTNSSPGDYSRAFLETTWEVTNATPGELPPPSFFQRAAHVLRHDFKDPDDLGVEMHGWGDDAAADGSWWSTPESNPREFHLRVSRPGSTNTALVISSHPLTFPTLFGLDWWFVLAFAGLLLGLLAAFLAAWFIASRVLLLHHCVNGAVPQRNFLVAVCAKPPKRSGAPPGGDAAVQSFIRFETEHLQLRCVDPLDDAPIGEKAVLVYDWRCRATGPTNDESSKLVRIAAMDGTQVLVMVGTAADAKPFVALGAEQAGTWTLRAGDEPHDAVVSALAAHFQKWWKPCTPAERMALWEIAQRGFVDADHPTVPSLLHRGLLRLDPKLRLPSASFRRFVLSFSAEQLDTAQADGAKNNWPMIRSLLVVVALAVMAFLMLTQPDTWQRTTGVFAGLLAGFKLIGDLLGAVRKETEATPTQK